jgi:hypothetical protein
MAIGRSALVSGLGAGEFIRVSVDPTRLTPVVAGCFGGARWHRLGHPDHAILQLVRVNALS